MRRGGQEISTRGMFFVTQITVHAMAEKVAVAHTASTLNLFIEPSLGDGSLISLVGVRARRWWRDETGCPMFMGHPDFAHGAIRL